MQTAARLLRTDRRRLLAKLERAISYLRGVGCEIARANPDLRELLEERAAVREFDGKLSRADAELLALLDLLRAVSDPGG